MKAKHWYDYLWVYAIIYFALGFFNILFAWLGIQPGQQSLFDNEHTVYETVKVGEADGVLGTSTDEHGKNVYTLSWEHRGITHTVMGNIPYDEIMKIAEGIR